MKPDKEKDSYPIFEADQVLSHLHLNQLFNYLDQQERLTRADLIGIGIVCGLEIRFDPNESPTALHLGTGCGITSEGYLVVEPCGVTLESYRKYTLPSDRDYPQFKDGSIVQYPLWELFPAGEPETKPLSTPADFLNDKAVLLFLELKKEGLRNCSPNNCDDKGSAVTATQRRLLISRSDLDRIIEEAGSIGSGLSSAELAHWRLAMLGLDDLRLPRYDVPDTGPTSSLDILTAFHALFRAGDLVSTTAKALTGAYKAFKPVLQGAYPSDPFAGFGEKFGFLETTPKTMAQVRFLQYFYDFFDDIIKAYDEFRWKGAELICACCPPDGLFPRHLMLGVPAMVEPAKSGVYRQQFLASPAFTRCGDELKDLLQLFQRLVEMINRFTEAPPLADSPGKLTIDRQIRVTPSMLGGLPLSERAIPYYYHPDGTPPLNRLWNTVRTRRNRANQNPGYHADRYSPPAPPFISDPLRFDLEPYNFLRIEGHLGKNCQSVMRTLLSLKETYRLPIDIIALRTGAFDEENGVDLDKEECRFQDLESLYDALREELLSNLCEGVMYLYGIGMTGSNLTGGKPGHPLLKKHAPTFHYANDSVGAWYENYLELIQSRPYIDVDQNRIDNDAVLMVYCTLFTGTSGLPAEYFAHVVSIYYLSTLAEVLPDSLNTLGYADFENKYQDLLGLIRYLRSDAVHNISKRLAQFIPQEELIDHFDQVLFSCKLDAVKSIHDAYLRRLREVKQQQFLSFFLRRHPGIQHKAGVPLGGTFIVVYHQNPDPIKSGISYVAGKSAIDTGIREAKDRASTALSGALNRLRSKDSLLADPDIQTILGELTGQVPAAPFPAGEGGPRRDAGKIFSETIAGFEDGTVIADFYLPYLCCSDFAPVQFVLPLAPLGLAVQLGCTSPLGVAEATLTPKGGMAPYTYQLDHQPFRELSGKLALPVGPHTLALRDSSGAESAPQAITVPATLTLGPETYTDLSDKTYQVGFEISGGTAPYKSEDGTVAGSSFTSGPLPSGEKISITIADSVGCKVTGEFAHTVCNLPCDGLSRRCAYRLWLQPPYEDATYESYKQEGNIRFSFNGEEIELPDAGTLLQIPSANLNRKFPESIRVAVDTLNEAINEALTKKFGPESGKNRLVVTYEPTKQDPFGILWIEHFACESFSIEFDYSYSKPAPFHSLTVRYAREPDTSRNALNGILFINRWRDKKETRVPAFDCSERNQCSGSEYRKLCEGPDPKPVFGIEPSGEDGFILTGQVENMPATEIAAWVWDAPLAQAAEPLYEGRKVEARLLKPAGPVQLTAITKKGCFGVVRKGIGQ
jgi:hypothetical protein